MECTPHSLQKPTFLSTPFWKIILENFVLDPEMSMNTCFSSLFFLPTDKSTSDMNQLKYSRSTFEKHINQLNKVYAMQEECNFMSTAANSDLWFTWSVHSYSNQISISLISPWVGQEQVTGTEPQNLPCCVHHSYNRLTWGKQACLCGPYSFWQRT